MAPAPAKNPKRSRHAEMVSPEWFLLFPPTWHGCLGVSLCWWPASPATRGGLSEPVCRPRVLARLRLAQLVPCLKLHPK